MGIPEGQDHLFLLRRGAAPWSSTSKTSEIVRVTSDREAGINHGNLCVKGRFGFDYVHSPDRLTDPLIKERETFRPRLLG